jgi:hypothetical protein
MQGPLTATVALSCSIRHARCRCGRGGAHSARAANGTSTTLAADVDINVNAAIDGVGATPGVTHAHRGNDINVNEFHRHNNGAINLLATGGTVT